MVDSYTSVVCMVYWVGWETFQAGLNKFAPKRYISGIWALSKIILTLAPAGEEPQRAPADEDHPPRTVALVVQPQSQSLAVEWS